MKSMYVRQLGKLLVMLLLGFCPWRASYGYSTTYDYVAAPTMYTPSAPKSFSNPGVVGKPIYITSTSIFFNTQAGSPVSYFQGDYGTWIGYDTSAGTAFVTSEVHGATGVAYGSSVNPNVSASWLGAHGLSPAGAREITSNGLLFYSAQDTYTLKSASDPFSYSYSTTASIIPTGWWVDLNDLTSNQAETAPPLGNLAVSEERQGNGLALSWRVQ